MPQLFMFVGTLYAQGATQPNEPNLNPAGSNAGSDGEGDEQHEHEGQQHHAHLSDRPDISLG